MFLYSIVLGNRFGIWGNEEGRRELRDHTTVLNLGDQKDPDKSVLIKIGKTRGRTELS